MEVIMSKTKNFSAEEKVTILREHLDNKSAISDLSEKYGLNPNVIYLWKKQLFENASVLFERKSNNQVRESSQDKQRIQELEVTLSGRETLISELVTELVSIKKKQIGEASASNGSNRKSGIK
jgi:transposase-like protein